jgi:CRP-like cAMP-binding protein
MDTIDMLRQTALVEGLSNEELAAIAPVCQERQFGQGEEIFGEASKGTELYIVCRGRVSLEVALPNRPGRGAERLATATAGMVFGEMSLVDRSPRSARARTLEETLVIEISSADLHKVMEENPRIGYVIMGNLATVLASRLRSTNLWLRNELLWSR